MQKLTPEIMEIYGRCTDSVRVLYGGLWAFVGKKNSRLSIFSVVLSIFPVVLIKKVVV